MIGRVALALLTLAGAARDDPLAGRVAGPAADCIELDRVQGPTIADDGRAILYPKNLRRVWRTEPIGACPGLDRFARLVVEVQGRRLCRNDRFHPIQPGGLSGATCRFAAFVPYDRPAKP